MATMEKYHLALIWTELLKSIQQNGIVNMQHTQESISSSKEESLPKLDPPVPNVIMLGVLFLLTIATIVAGYVHGNMHLITVLKNAAS